MKLIGVEEHFLTAESLRPYSSRPTLDLPASLWRFLRWEWNACSGPRLSQTASVLPSAG
jgi:hypothetical protein